MQSNTVQFLSVDEVLEIHARLILRFGGADGRKSLTPIIVTSLLGTDGLFFNQIVEGVNNSYLSQSPGLRL